MKSLTDRKDSRDPENPRYRRGSSSRRSRSSGWCDVDCIERELGRAIDDGGHPAGSQGHPVAAGPCTGSPGPLSQTLNGLAGRGSFSGAKGTYIQGGLGRIEGIAARPRSTDKAAAKGYFPLAFVVADIDQNGPMPRQTSPPPSNTGATKTEPVTFVAGPSPTGWQISKQSALACCRR